MSKKKSFEHEIDPELLAEIEEWEQQDHDKPEGYYFSNPDPYLKPAPLPPDHPKHNFWFDEDGHICVKNPSAFWLPEFTLQKEIGGTIYSITGTYDGTETLDKKMERIMAEKFTEKLEDTKPSRGSLKWKSRPCGRILKYRNDRLKTLSSLSRGYTNTRSWTSLRPMLCGNLSREFTSKPPTRAAANGGRTSAFPTTLWVLSR